jgi:hypothetical protein
MISNFVLYVTSLPPVSVVALNDRLSGILIEGWGLLLRAGMMASRLNHREHVIPALTDH